MSRGPVVPFAVGVVTVALVARTVAGCSSFEGEPSSSADASPVDDVVSPALDGGADTASPSDSGPALEFCSARDAALCFDFPRSPVTLGWDSVDYPIDGSTTTWIEAGATAPGSAQFMVGPLGGSSNVQRIQLTRRLAASARFRQLRFDIAVRLDEVPDLGKNAIVRLFAGNAIFYIYQSNVGWTFVHGYYAPICVPGPCNGATLTGTKLPAKPGTWERLSFTLVEEDGGVTYRGTFDATNGEHLEFATPVGFDPRLNATNYLQVGFTDTTASAGSRVFDVDDIALTIE